MAGIARPTWAGFVGLIAVVVGFVGAFDGDVDVGGLFGGEFGEFDADFFEV